MVIYRKIIEDKLKSLRYDATPAEIDQIVANSRYIKLDKESGVSNLEMGLSGEVSQFVNDNTLTYKDLNRIFTAELGRNPTVEERTEILGTSSTKVRIKGSEDLVFNFTENVLDDEYSETAVSWWDVRRPDVFFGVQGERTDEQKGRVQQFRQEWGNVRGAAAVNGLIDGTYTANQLSENWGAENLASVIRAESFEVGEFNEGDDFGSYLQSQFDNVSSFINPSGEGLRGTLGTIDTALAQGSGGPKGAERGVTVTAGDLASSSYMTAVRSAAETAGIDIYVDGPAGGQYELNVGQYDDVPLGSYHTVREADSPLEMLFETVLKEFVIGVLTAGIATDLQALGAHLSSSGAVATAEAATAGSEVVYETKQWASDLGSILTGIGEGLEAGGVITETMAQVAPGAACLLMLWPL